MFPVAKVNGKNGKGVNPGNKIVFHARNIQHSLQAGAPGRYFMLLPGTGRRRWHLQKSALRW